MNSVVGLVLHPLGSYMDLGVVGTSPKLLNVPMFLSPYWLSQGVCTVFSAVWCCWQDKEPKPLPVARHFLSLKMCPIDF